MVQEYGRYFGMPTCCLRGGCLTGPNHTGVELHGFLSYLSSATSKAASTSLRLQGQAGPRQHPLRDVARFMHAFIRSATRAARSTTSAAARATRARSSRRSSWWRIYRNAAAIQLRRREPDRRPHLLLQRPAKMQDALSGLEHHEALDEIFQEIVAAWSGRLIARHRELRYTMMSILITGVCGFVGSTLADAWVGAEAGHALYRPR